MSTHGQSRGAASSSERGADDRSVLQIAKKVAATVGADFFNAIAKHLAKALSADCVLIGEFTGGGMEMVRTLGACLDGHPTTFQYELAGSAAAEVAVGKSCMCRSSAASRFPHDELLRSVGAQAVIAAPLENTQRGVMGLIMVLYRRPVASFRVAKHVLDIFSERAAAELSRKRREDELCESEQRHRAFIARNADAMWRIEFEHPIALDQPEEVQFSQIFELGYLAECNDATARLFGLEKAQQLVGCRLGDIVSKSDASQREATMLAIRAGYEFTTVETNPVDRFGMCRHIVRSQWGIVEEGKLERIWGTSRDITQLVHSEQALDASEQRMVDLLENLQLLVVMVDLDGTVAFCNNYLYRKTGWQHGEVIGKEWLSLMVPAEEHNRVRAAFASGATKPEAPLHYGCTLLGPHGGHWQIEWDRTMLRDPKGRIAAWANVGRDVTEHRALEEQLRQAQKLAVIGRLAGGLAHDFNNLLTVIMGYSAALLSERDESDPAYLGLSQIRKAAGKGAELTHRLLAFGRRQVLRPDIMNLNTVIADAEHMIRHLIGDDVRLTTDLDRSLWRVRIDSGCFHQVLMNLAANARDAMPRGGSLVIATANLTVDTETAQATGVCPGEYVEVTVTDTGIGLTEEVRNHLFEPFFTTKEKGTGLGLSTVYGIVRQSGGNIFVSSVPRKGTTFKMYFPRAEGVEPAPVDTTSSSAAPHGTETILLVEDREDVRQLLSQTLQQLGYTVLEADGPAIALELAQDRRQTIHLLLTDVAMPDMDGFELAEHVAAYRHQVKVLFMSGFADAPKTAEKLAEPGCANLQKPFTPDLLAVTVRKVLDQQ